MVRLGSDSDLISIHITSDGINLDLEIYITRSLMEMDVAKAG